MQNCWEQRDQQSGDFFSTMPEPEPDYQDDDLNDFPPPPSPLTLSQLTSKSDDDNDNNNNSNNSNNNYPGTRGQHSTAKPDVTGFGAHSEGAVWDDARERSQPRVVLPPDGLQREREAVHRELLLNQKTGRDILGKPELSRVLTDRKATQKRKEWQQQQASKRTSFELKLEKQANKLREGQEDKMKTITETEAVPEFMQIHRRITHKGPKAPPT